MNQASHRSSLSRPIALFAVLGAIVAIAPACAPKSQNTPSEEAPVDSGHSQPPGQASACGDDKPCPVGQICKRGDAAAPTACVKACGEGRGMRPVGDTFPGSDGCNTCSCTEAGFTCTEKACECNPQVEGNRQYKIKDPDQCKAALFQCPAGAKPFFNKCGCGCEQPASCPANVDCMPGPGAPPCEADAIKKRCPLSTIAL